MLRLGYGCWPRKPGEDKTAQHNDEVVPAGALERGYYVVALVPHPGYPCGDWITAEVRGKFAVDWAEADQSINGTTWEGTGDPGYAYATLMNDPGLVRKLRAEGYRLDVAQYVEPQFCDTCRSEGLTPYYTVVIPFEPDPARRTPWHPTESTGPFAKLTRGVFKDEAEAHAWAREHLGEGATYTVEECRS